MTSTEQLIELAGDDLVNFWVFSPPISVDAAGKLDLRNGLAFPTGSDGKALESVNCHRLFNDVGQDTTRLALYKQNKDIKSGKNRKYLGYIYACVDSILSIQIDDTKFSLKHHPVPENPPDPANYAHCDLELHSTSRSRKVKIKEDLYEKFSPLVPYEN